LTGSDLNGRALTGVGHDLVTLVVEYLWISSTAQVMHQATASDHAALHDNAEICLESLETDIRLLRRLFVEFDLVEKLNDES